MNVSARYEYELDDVIVSDLDGLLMLEAEPALRQEKDREVGALDAAESYFVTHFSISTSPAIIREKESNGETTEEAPESGRGDPSAASAGGTARRRA